jgi:diketogulonate reductase-like aldo/keto reductase
LIHSPYLKDNKYDEALVSRAWSPLETIQQAGKVRFIGVSNFRRQRITNLLKTATVTPSVNEIQSYPYLQGAPQKASWLLREHDIQVEAKMSLAPITHLRGKHLESLLKSLAEKYWVGEGVVLIRWMLGLGAVVLNTTKKAGRLQEYLSAIRWALEESDREGISRLAGRGFV